MPRCAIPGCRNGTTIKGLVCTAHGVQIWAHIESVRGKDGFHVAEAVKRQQDRMEREAAENERALAATRAEGWIYILALDEKIKVGWTANFEQRMKSYPPHSRLLARYPASRADERDLHRTLRISRVAGREWYERTPQVEALIADIHRRNQEQYAAEVARRRAESEATRPQGVRVASSRPRRSQPRGQALVRAILDGTEP